MEHINNFHMLGGPLIVTALVVGSLLMVLALIIFVRPKQVVREVQSRQDDGEQRHDDV